MTHIHRTIPLLLGTLLILAACTGGPLSPTVTADELAARIEAGKPPIVLDVRTAEEYAAGHIPGAINLPHDQLETRLGRFGFSRNDEVVVYCRSGRRAGLAENMLRNAGYKSIRDLDGHYLEWTAGNRPLATTGH